MRYCRSIWAKEPSFASASPFYADTLVLKHLLNPVFTREDRDFDRLAIVPLSKFVCDWVTRHSEPH